MKRIHWAAALALALALAAYFGRRRPESGLVTVTHTFAFDEGAAAGKSLPASAQRRGAASTDALQIDKVGTPTPEAPPPPPPKKK